MKIKDILESFGSLRTRMYMACLLYTSDAADE